MPEVHTIRLRGPWRYRPLARSVWLADGRIGESEQDLPPPGRMEMPADWAETLGGDFRGRVRYQRRFGRPTGREPQETVWLVFEGAHRVASISLNGRLLGKVHGRDMPERFDVTALLNERNEMTVDVELPLVDPPEKQPGGLTGEVSLEIHGA